MQSCISSHNPAKPTIAYSMRVNTPTPKAHVSKFQLKTPTKNQLKLPKITIHNATMFAITICFLLLILIVSAKFIWLCIYINFFLAIICLGVIISVIII